MRKLRLKPAFLILACLLVAQSRMCLGEHAEDKGPVTESSEKKSKKKELTEEEKKALKQKEDFQKEIQDASNDPKKLAELLEKTPESMKEGLGQIDDLVNPGSELTPDAKQKGLEEAATKLGLDSSKPEEVEALRKAITQNEEKKVAAIVAKRKEGKNLSTEEQKKFNDWLKHPTIARLYPGEGNLNAPWALEMTLEMNKAKREGNDALGLGIAARLYASSNQEKLKSNGQGFGANPSLYGDGGGYLKDIGNAINEKPTEFKNSGEIWGAQQLRISEYQTLLKEVKDGSNPFSPLVFQDRYGKTPEQKAFFMEESRRGETVPLEQTTPRDANKNFVFQIGSQTFLVEQQNLSNFSGAVAAGKVGSWTMNPANTVVASDETVRRNIGTVLEQSKKEYWDQLATDMATVQKLKEQQKVKESSEAQAASARREDLRSQLMKASRTEVVLNQVIPDVDPSTGISNAASDLTTAISDAERRVDTHFDRTIRILNMDKPNYYEPSPVSKPTAQRRLLKTIPSNQN